MFHRFGIWWGWGGGVIGAIASTALSSVDVPRATSVEVHATAPLLSSGVAASVFVLACALVAGITGFRSTSRLSWPDPIRVRFGIAWSIVALACAVANIYLIYQPGPDWLYTSRTLAGAGPVAIRESIHARNPYFVNLLMTFVGADLVGGILSSLVLGPSWLRSVSLTAAWTVALSVGALLAWFGSYLITLNVVHVLQALSLGVLLPKLIGMCAAGFLTGYVSGCIGSMALPKAA